MKHTLITLVCLLGFQTIFFAGNVKDTIYINSGQGLFVNGKQMPYKGFNSTPTYENRNAQLSVGIMDTLVLTIVNNDTILHGFDIRGISGYKDTLQQGDTLEVTFHSSTPRVCIYYDHINYPNNAYMGLAGILAVGANDNTYYWNIKDHQSDWNDSIASGGVVNWLDYYPDYFTINGLSNPDINSDTTARVEGNIGDTILIFMANTGQAEHSIHFHGYHCEILYSTSSPMHTGRIKDTFPLKRMEGYLLRLVPHQTGEYPVHDHNLLSITGGGLYPFGMFLTILIQ